MPLKLESPCNCRSPSRLMRRGGGRRADGGQAGTSSPLPSPALSSSCRPGRSVPLFPRRPPLLLSRPQPAWLPAPAPRRVPEAPQHPPILGPPAGSRTCGPEGSPALPPKCPSSAQSHFWFRLHCRDRQAKMGEQSLAGRRTWGVSSEMGTQSCFLPGEGERPNLLLAGCQANQHHRKGPPSTPQPGPTSRCPSFGAKQGRMHM